VKFLSTGISISSINRIKELAEQKKFKEALEILDTQNLEKSINPQFMKISGEIFRENKRYYDSRKILLKAHQMAPEGNRIIHELIQLYLELGYFSKAQKYYEQYKFYTTPDDTQQEYVEYIMKKAMGADVKELATILIPILERLPEDRWNFEAVLLYHKMDRKDMALEESRYILENFKESEYIQPVIDYINDALDVDQMFYVYPKEEQTEDTELFGDLIDLEEKILQADHLRMYPPEARIMVEVEDKDAMDIVPVKEKKPKKPKKPSKKKVKEPVTEEVAAAVDTGGNEVKEAEVAEAEIKDTEVSTQEAPSTQEGTSTDDLATQSAEASVNQEREAVLEKILSKKIDTDKIKESAKQVAQAMKDIDTDKAKKQVKSVAITMKDNVKKATETLGEAVGVKPTVAEVTTDTDENATTGDDFIMDGIIESVLEPPKRAVGEVVTNEELDSLIPDSLEAMSQQEIADIEARKEEYERLELEALEAALKLEEEKKAKKLHRLQSEDGQDETTVEAQEEKIVNEDAEQDDGEVTAENNSETNDEEKEQPSQEVENEPDSEEKELILQELTGENSSYIELKNSFLEEQEDIKPLDSLGFITVIHSDVDAVMEEEVPDAAGILRQMIGNKEFYSGENSLGFESEASYQNHGFEVEDYDFDTYRKQQEEQANSEEQKEVSEESITEATTPVEEIFVEEDVVTFEDIAETDSESIVQEEVMEEAEEELVFLEEPEEEPIFMEEEAEEELVFLEEPEEEESIFMEEEVEEELVFMEEPEEEESIFMEEEVEEELVFLEEPEQEESIFLEEEVEEELIFLEEPEEEEPIFMEEEVEEELVFLEEPEQEEPIFMEEEVEEELVFLEEPDIEEEQMLVQDDGRLYMRTSIILSTKMENVLQNLKESR